jgi:hypothetical protein
MTNGQLVHHSDGPCVLFLCCLFIDTEKTLLHIISWQDDWRIMNWKGHGSGQRKTTKNLVMKVGGMAGIQTGNLQIQAKSVTV